MSLDRKEPVDGVTQLLVATERETQMQKELKQAEEKVAKAKEAAAASGLDAKEAEKRAKEVTAAEKRVAELGRRARDGKLGLDDLKRPNDAFEVGEPLVMKVTRVDVPNHRLILSVKAWLTEQDDIALAEWTSKRNQVRARIAATPPAEEPASPKIREDVGDEE